MEKNLNEQQQELLSLIEVKAFNELTNSERDFVLKQISQHEYELQHTVIAESLYVSADMEPLPLQIVKKRALVIPLYQAVLGIASAVIISFFIFRSETTIIQPGNEIIIAQTDTVYVDKVIVDTVVEYKTQYIGKTSKNVKCTDANHVRTNREPVASFSAPQLPEFLSMNVTNKGIAGINKEINSLVNDSF